MLRIAIDVRTISGQKAGKGRFTFELVKELAKLDRDNHYLLFSNRDFDLSLPPNFEKKIIPLPSWLWHFWVALLISFLRLDIYLAPSSLIVPAISFSKKTVLVIHDLCGLNRLFGGTFKTRFLENVFLKIAIKRAKHIITVSENTKKDILKHLKISGEKIEVIYEGAGENFKPKNETEISKLKTKYSLSGDFILFVGTLEPRKNLVKLIRAYYLLEGELKRKYALVIAGKKGWAFSPIFKEVEKLKLKDRVRFLDYVSEEDLPALYSAATLFAFPSLYEGFGLPVLEAMRCGTPVLSSNTSSIPEITKDAALLINPLDEQEIAQGITRILKNERMRKEMSRKGARRAGGFSFRQTARQMLNLLEKV